MKKIYLLFFVFIFLLTPITYGVAVYQLDQPISELNGYTLREVFENRNMAMPDLSTATDLGGGNYRKYNNYGITLDYNVNTGIWTLNGVATVTVQPVLVNIEQNTEYTLSNYVISGTAEGGWVVLSMRNPTLTISDLLTSNQTTFNTTTQGELTIFISAGRTFTNYQFKLQLEKGSTATPYTVPTNAPYSDIDLSQFNLTVEQIQKYYDLYLEALRFEIENDEAYKDPGGYQLIIKSIVNGVKDLINSMAGVWHFLNSPIISSDLANYKLEIDWSWDIVNVISQIIGGLGVLILQVNFIFINLLFTLTGIPVQITILSLLFSNVVFVILGWIVVKSFII